MAFGHYHVKREIAPNAFYAGSLEYTSTNPWGELYEERVTGLPGKGFLEYDLDTRTATVSSRRAGAAAHRSRGRVGARALGAGARCGHSPRGRRVRRWDRRAGRAPRSCAMCHDTSRVSSIIGRCATTGGARCTSISTRVVPRSSARRAAGSPGRRPTLTDTVEAYLTHRRLEGDLDRERAGVAGTPVPERGGRRRAARAGGNRVVRLNSVALSNFRQHADTQIEFDRDSPASSALTARGKSTMLEAIAWAIYGNSAARGTRDTIRFNRAGARARCASSSTSSSAAIAIASSAG